MDAEEIETYADIRPGMGIFDALAAYLRTPGFGFSAREADGRPGLLPSFRDWMVRQWAPPGGVDTSRAALASFDTLETNALSLCGDHEYVQKIRERTAKDSHSS